jgi:hypothetical protein
VALQELQIYGLWAGKQTARGTANAAPGKRFKWLGSGPFQPGRTDGSEQWSDLTMFPGITDWVDTISGAGAPDIEATPEELAWLFWALEGGESTAAVTGPPAKTKHTTVPLPGIGHWLTFQDRQGSSVLQRRQYVDCQIGQLVVTGGTQAKAVRVTPSVISLDPAIIAAADPAAALTAKIPFLYTDGTSRFSIDGTVFRGHSAFTLTVNKDLQPVYADDTVVHDVAIGNAGVTISVTLYFDSNALAQWNKLVYGVVNPAAGVKPLRTVAALGSYGFDLRARDGAGAVNGDKFVLALAGVKWNVPDAPAPNPAGGAGEITLAGSGRISGSNPRYQVDIDCDAAAFTA